MKAWGGGDDVAPCSTAFATQRLSSALAPEFNDAFEFLHASGGRIVIELFGRETHASTGAGGEPLSLAAQLVPFVLAPVGP